MEHRSLKNTSVKHLWNAVRLHTWKRFHGCDVYHLTNAGNVSRKEERFVLVVKWAPECRVRCGWKKFTELRPGSSPSRHYAKWKGSCVRSGTLYGSETRAIKAEDRQRLHCNEMSMIRSDVTLRGKYSWEELRAQVGIKSIVAVMRPRGLRWYCHVERRVDGIRLTKVQTSEFNGVIRRGRTSKTWEHVITEDLHVTESLHRTVTNGDLQLHEQSNPCLRGLIIPVLVSTLI